MEGRAREEDGLAFDIGAVALEAGADFDAGFAAALEAGLVGALEAGFDAVVSVLLQRVVYATYQLEPCCIVCLSNDW